MIWLKQLVHNDFEYCAFISSDDNRSKNDIIDVIVCYIKFVSLNTGSENLSKIVLMCQKQVCQR